MTIDPQLSLARRFFGGRGQAMHAIRQALYTADKVRIATAYFEASGYELLYDVLEGKAVKLLVGRPEQGRDRVEEVFSEFVDTLTAAPMEHRTQALRTLRDALARGQLVIAVGDDADTAVAADARYLYHHAKLYIADQDAAVVTSANMSYHGLYVSREAGYTVTDEEDVRFFVERFDDYFDQAAPIAEALMKHLMHMLDDHLPYDVYIRALVELYGLPDEEVPARLPALAMYQRPLVSRALNALMDYRGSMMVASTGLGKTIMAGHIVAYLRMRNVIDRVVVICPAGLREMWRRTMRGAVVSSETFSYNTLSRDDRRSDSVRALEYELRTLTPTTLLILDESHHMRNRKRRTKQRLRYERISDAVHESQALSLLLTATPFSRSIRDINNQLRLLPEYEAVGRAGMFDIAGLWSIETAAELSELPSCAVLTTPTVVQEFSAKDEAGERYVVFSGDDRRYFPRAMHLHTMEYDNSLDDLIAELLSQHLLMPRQAETPQMSMFDDMPTGKGANWGLIKSHVMHQMCSSPAQAADLFGKLGKLGGFEKTRFAYQEELTEWVEKHTWKVRRAQREAVDEKLQAVLRIIQDYHPEKVVVFCQYIASAEALTEAINSHFNGRIRAETTARQSGSKVDYLLRTFAPVANDVAPEERPNTDERIDVLVATGALAEGFNLQDAPVLINYDLSWTVLTLAQRMGRILRPWHEPREIHIYNLIPSTMNDTRIQMALNWRNRLLDRNRQYAAFADIPVMLEETRDKSDRALEMFALATQLTAEQEITLDLDETLRFMERTEGLKTSSFLTDLALIDEKERSRIEGLPAGFRSARETSHSTALFLLLRYRRRPYAALFNRNGDLIYDHEARDRIMDRIRCEEETPLARASLYPTDDEFDQWIERARQAWAKEHKRDARDVTYIAAMALMHAQ